MFLVIDPDNSKRLFFAVDPRLGGFTGPVELVRYEEVDDLNEWPDGSARPTPTLGQSPEDTKHYRVFRSGKDCKAAGFEVLGNHFSLVLIPWSEYRSPRNIEFPDRHSVVFERECISFPSEVDGSRVLCEISIETLIRDYGARTPKDLENAFVANKELIRKHAKNLIAASGVRDGKLIVK